MLRRREPGRDRLLLAPVQEAAQADPELEQALVVGVGNLCGPQTYRATIGVGVGHHHRGLAPRAGPPDAASSRAIAVAPRRGRGRGRVGADPPHRADHQRGALPPVGLGPARRSRTSIPGRSCSSRPRRAGLAVSLIAKWAPVIRGHGIPEAMEAVLTRQSRIAPRAAVAKPLVGRDRDRHRWPVRRRRPDHRHRRRDRLAHRPGDPRDAVRAQDPAGVRRRRRHVGDVRRAARRGGARDRAAAVRVLEPRVRAARRRVERRRRDARRALRPRPALPRPDPRLRRVSTSLPGVRARSGSRAACSRS